MADFEAVINLPNVEEFDDLYQLEISKGGVFVNTPLRQPEMSAKVIITFRVHGIEGDLRIQGQVVQVTDMTGPQGAGIAVQLTNLTKYMRDGIEAALVDPSCGWPEELDEELITLMEDLEARIERARTREVMTDLGLGDDPRLEDIDHAFSEFTKAFHPDRFASKGSEKIKDLATTLFALTKKTTDRIRREAERAARIKDAVKQKVAERAPVEPLKTGTTGPLQKPRVAYEASRRRKGTRPVPRPKIEPAAKSHTGPVAKPDTGPTAPTIELVDKPTGNTPPQEADTDALVPEIKTGPQPATESAAQAPEGGFGLPPQDGFGTVPDFEAQVPEVETAVPQPGPEPAPEPESEPDPEPEPEPAAPPEPEPEASPDTAPRSKLSPAMQRAIARRKAKARGKTGPASEPQAAPQVATPSASAEPKKMSAAVARAIAKRKAKAGGETKAVPKPSAQPGKKAPGKTGPSKRRPRLTTGSITANIDPLQESAEGKLALRRKEYTKAKQAFARAVVADPGSPESLSQLGRATFLEDHDNHEEARKLLEKAASLDKDYEWPYVYLGQMSKLMGKNKRAMEHFRQALRINPRNHEAKLELSVLERRKTSPPQPSPGGKQAKGKGSLLGGLFSRGKKK